MTTREFIGKCVHGYIANERTCSSVYFDGKHIYSYGTHYPLLIQVAGKWILNDAGYSNTTAKHINWASGYADYTLNIPNGRSAERNDPQGLLEIANKELESLQSTYDSKKRKDTKVAASLLQRIETITKTRDFLART